MNKQIETLESAYDYIRRLCQGIEENIELYRSGRETEANEMFIQVVDGFTWVVDALALTRDAQADAIDFSNTKEICGEMIEALENKDTVLIADMLEYEVLPLLDNWHEAIGMILGVAQ